MIKNNFIKGMVFIALVTGIIGTTGSYGYFNAQSNINSNLKITTGNLEVNFYNNKVTDNVDLNFNGLSVDKGITKSFNIKNTGNLNENIKLQFIRTDSEKNLKQKPISSRYLKYFNYQLDFYNSSDKKIKTYSGALDKLFNEEFILQDSKGNKYPLYTGEKLKVQMNIILDSSIKDDMNYSEIRNFKNNILKFKLDVIGSQLNEIS
jgi:hypothetical protein